MNKLLLKPILDHVIIERKASETTTNFGLIIPDSFAAKPDHGVVLAVGPGRRDKKGEYVAPQVAIGDHILFDGRTGFEVEYGGKTYLVLKEVNIYAKIKG